MARGGKREGAGRPEGSVGSDARQLARILSKNGITPLEVLLETMRQLWTEGDKRGACEVARHAAPFVHPKLQSTKLETEHESFPQPVIVLQSNPLTEEQWIQKYGARAPELGEKQS